MSYALKPFCADCGKRTPKDSVHTCSPQASEANRSITPEQVEILLDAASEWSEYVIEDTAPISNHDQIKHAISIAFPGYFKDAS